MWEGERKEVKAIGKGGEISRERVERVSEE